MKTTKILVCALLIIALLPINVLATSETTDATDIIYFEDGSYLTVKTIVVDARESFTKNASRLYEYYSSSNVKKWEATLIATFIYDGASCTCASSSVQVNILDSAWYIVSKEESKSGNTAIGDLVMGYKFLGITTTKKTVNMSITCDKDGNLS